jgi:hypothetical protein
VYTSLGLIKNYYGTTTRVGLFVSSPRYNGFFVYGCAKSFYKNRYAYGHPFFWRGLGCGSSLWLAHKK